MNIVFDLGGVVLTWNPDAIISGLFQDPDTQSIVRSEIFDHDDWLELDRGTLDPGGAVARGAARTGLPTREIAVLLDRVPESLVPIPGMVDLLYRLREGGHPLYCLSNMHVASIEHLERAHAFWEVFGGTVISCRVHMIKPEPGIYAHLLETHALEAANTVFVDDLDVNLRAAETFGIGTILFRDPDSCEEQLRLLGCL